MEQSYKEKYEQAIERLKQWDREHPCAGYVLSDRDKFIFPELGENKDERIRKEIITYFQCQSEEEPTRKEIHNKWIAWLEKQGDYANFRDKAQVGDRITKNEDGVLVNLSQLKRVAKPADSYCQDCTNRKGCMNCENGELRETEQKPVIEFKTAEESLGISSDEYNKIVDECIFCEQKPADTVEPKFKVGDWIIGDEGIFKITQYENEYGYELTGTTGHVAHFISPDYVESNYHIWTIQDAKDGDVLADNDGVILFRKIGNERYADVVDYYCVVNTSGRFEIQERFDYWGEANDAQLHPATKEQREQLEKAMTDAGYTFDFERKKLEKIKPKTKEDKGNVGGISANWSEEDEENYQHACLAIRSAGLHTLEDKKDLEDWLKSLKDRVQPKQEWSEDDKRKIDRIYSILRQAADTHAFSTSCRLIGDKECMELQDFLKSLRPQNHWKPNESEIIILEKLIKGELEPKVFPKTLHGILEQLKKLKENKL